MHRSVTRTSPGLANGFGEIFNRLLPSSGHIQTPGPFFERYDEAFDPCNSNSLVEICLPIKSIGSPKGTHPV